MVGLSHAQSGSVCSVLVEVEFELLCALKFEVSSAKKQFTVK